MSIQIGRISGHWHQVDALDRILEHQVIGDSCIEDGDLYPAAPRGVVPFDTQPTQEVTTKRDGTILRTNGFEFGDGQWEN